MLKFLDWLEELEIYFALTCARIYMANTENQAAIPEYTKFLMYDWQEDLTHIIRHYIKFEDTY